MGRLWHDGEIKGNLSVQMEEFLRKQRERRSPGDDSYDASHVGYYGNVYRYGNSVIDYYDAVRPVLHLNLSSALWSKSGQVSSGETEEAIPGESPSASESAKPGGTPE